MIQSVSQSVSQSIRQWVSESVIYGHDALRYNAPDMTPPDYYSCLC